MKYKPYSHPFGCSCGSLNECRRVACRVTDPAGPVRILKLDPRQKPQRVQGSGCAQLPLYTQWPRVNLIIRGEYKNASRTRHHKILPQTGGVYGYAALVTTAFAALSGSDEDIGTESSVRLRFTGQWACRTCGLQSVRNAGPLADDKDPQAPLNAAPSLVVRETPWHYGGQGLWSFGPHQLRWSERWWGKLETGCGGYRAGGYTVTTVFQVRARVFPGVVTV